MSRAVDPAGSDANGAAQARDESFVGRWSRRKRAEPDQREGEDARVAQAQDQQRAAVEAARAPAPLAPLTAPADLPAIETLTPDSDYSRFMQADVPLASRNAAMKKLFTDPHFNVMDGLDTYIDDYTKFDPIPESMLRGLAQSRMLKLFDYSKEEAEEEAERVRLRAQSAVPATTVADPVAQAGGAELPALLAAENGDVPVEPIGVTPAVAIAVAPDMGPAGATDSKASLTRNT